MSPAATSFATRSANSSKDPNAGGISERGSALKTCARALASPESRPYQNGELAASAWSSGRCERT